MFIASLLANRGKESSGPQAQGPPPAYTEANNNYDRPNQQDPRYVTNPHQYQSQQGPFQGQQSYTPHQYGASQQQYQQYPQYSQQQNYQQPQPYSQAQAYDRSQAYGQPQAYNQPQPYGPPQQQYQPQYPPSQPQWQPQQPYDQSQTYSHSQQYGGPTSPTPSQLESFNVAEATAQLPQLPPRRDSSGPRPCVIPQIAKKFGGENMSPFVRARIPELETTISSHELIVFIDELNEAFLANPALQTADHLANIGGFVPAASVQMISLGVNIVAGVGSVAVTKVRMKNYLAKANEELFGPRGLHVQVCKTEKMLGYVGLDSKSSPFVRQQYRTVLENAQIQQMNTPVSPTGDSAHPIMGRMNALGDKVMALSFENVEEATVPDGFMKKWGAKAANKAEQKQINKMTKEQAKEEEKRLKEQAKKEEKAAKRVAKGKAEYVEKDEEKDHKKAEKKERKKAKKINKILWIVITRVEQSAGGDDDWDSEPESAGTGKHE